MKNIKLGIKNAAGALCLRSTFNPMPRHNSVPAGQRAALGLFVLLLAAVFNASLSTVFAQGSLTPPGAPAPTMKTLAQIEPRTPIRLSEA